MGYRLDRRRMTSKPVAFSGRSGRHQDHSGPYVSVFGKPVPHHEVPARFPGPLGLIQHSRRHSQIFFPWYIAMSISIPNRYAHSGHGPLWLSGAGLSEAPARTPMLPTWCILNASSSGSPNHSYFQSRSGSTNPQSQKLKVSKLPIAVSQTHVSQTH
jgi:hypothetical protein